MLYEVITILITGGIEVSPSVQRLIQGWTGIPVPVLFVESHTYDTVQSVNELYGRIEPTDTKRIATALGWFAKYVNVAELRITSYNVCYTKLLR